jgi:hypothetical protein
VPVDISFSAFHEPQIALQNTSLNDFMYVKQSLLAPERLLMRLIDNNLKYADKY